MVKTDDGEELITLDDFNLNWIHEVKKYYLGWSFHLLSLFFTLIPLFKEKPNYSYSDYSECTCMYFRCTVNTVLNVFMICTT